MVITGLTRNQLGLTPPRVRISPSPPYNKRTALLCGSFIFIPDLYESTSLSAFKQKRCITNLVNFGLIKCEIRGLPARRSFFIITDNELIKSIVDKGAEKIRSIKAAALSCEKNRRIYNAILSKISIGVVGLPHLSQTIQLLFASGCLQSEQYFFNQQPSIVTSCISRRICIQMKFLNW